MNDLDDLSARLDSVARNLSGPALRDVLTDIGVAAKGDIAREAAADVGADKRFSGWPKKLLSSGFEFEGDDAIIIRPRPKSAWRVANDGRRSGAIPRRRGATVTVRTPYGPRTVKGTNPIYNGTTRPMHTWDDAVDEITAETPDRVLDSMHRKVSGWLAI